MSFEDRLSETELTVEAISLLTNRVVDMTLEVRIETAELRAQGERDRVWMQEMLERMDQRIEENRRTHEASIEEMRRANRQLRPLWIHFGKQVGLPDDWIDEE